MEQTMLKYIISVTVILAILVLAILWILRIIDIFPSSTMGDAIMRKEEKKKEE